MLSEDTFLMDQVCGMAEVFARSMRIAAMMMILSYSFQRSWMFVSGRIKPAVFGSEKPAVF